MIDLRSCEIQIKISAISFGVLQNPTASFNRNSLLWRDARVASFRKGRQEFNGGQNPTAIY